MNKMKGYALDLACKYLLTPRSFSQAPVDIRRIDCNASDVERILNTSNNVLRLATKDGFVYFRECKRHVEIHQFVANEIEYYYTVMHPDLSEDRCHIEASLADRKRFAKFVNMGITNDVSSGAYHFCMGYGGEHIGLDVMPPAMEERVKDFVQCIWGELFAYRLNGGVRTGYYQTYNAVRSIATYRLAKLLGVEELIPQTEYAEVSVDGEDYLFGTIMKEAPGFSVEEMDEDDCRGFCSPELQRLLNNLNLLDVICHEKDHRPGNYHVTVFDGKVNHVMAFDNDSPNSFGMGGISFETYLGCSPWTLKGQLNRPFVDAKLAERILETTDKDLTNALSDLLNQFQLAMLKNRFHKVKKILAKTPKNRWLVCDAWSEDTMEKELSGAYGTTYMAKFIEKREMLYHPWLRRE